MGNKGEETHTHEQMESHRSVTFISSASKSLKAHLPARDEHGTPDVLHTRCGTKLNSFTVQPRTNDIPTPKHQPCKKCHKKSEASAPPLQQVTTRTQMPRFKRCGTQCANTGAGWGACSSFCGHGSRHKDKCLCAPVSTTTLMRWRTHRIHEATP